ncbi:MAG: response regulator transcription factor [Coprococcus sp.]|nr:response regulator transcription factor [Coprococcus sp.]
MIKILIVEDERPISDLIKLNLSDAGYDCTCAYNGMDAIDIVSEQTFDLMLLDIMLPGADGYEIMDYVRDIGIPVIFLTAKNTTPDKVKGLNMGAEDFIVKPFEIVELLARINVVLRRYHKTATTLIFKDLSIDLDRNTVMRGNEKVTLTPKEFDLLVLFVRNLNITLFRERIYESVWEAEYMGDTRTLDLHIQRLRKKAGIEEELKTIYRIGYRLEE